MHISPLFLKSGIVEPEERAVVGLDIFCAALSYQRKVGD
jgi:hypothetical protein